MTIDWISVETSPSMSRLRSSPMSSTPAMTPPSVPLPPSKSTPPSSTAAMTASSMPDAVVGAGAAVPQREDDAGEGGDGAGDDEQQQLDALDPDPGEERGLLLRADREQRPAEAGGVQDHADDDGEQDEQRYRVRDGRAGHVVLTARSV